MEGVEVGQDKTWVFPWTRWHSNVCDYFKLSFLNKWAIVSLTWGHLLPGIKFRFKTLYRAANLAEKKNNQLKPFQTNKLTVSNKYACILASRNCQFSGNLHDRAVKVCKCSGKFHSIGKMEKNEMGGACGAYGEGRGMHRVLVGKPEGKRPMGRPRCRWEDNITIDLREVGGGGDWMELAQDRERWRALANTVVMNLRVPQSAGNFLTSCRTS